MGNKDLSVSSFRQMCGRAGNKPCTVHDLFNFSLSLIYYQIVFYQSCFHLTCLKSNYVFLLPISYTFFNLSRHNFIFRRSFSGSTPPPPPLPPYSLSLSLSLSLYVTPTSLESQLTFSLSLYPTHTHTNTHTHCITGRYGLDSSGEAILMIRPTLESKILAKTLVAAPIDPLTRSVLKN